MRFRKSRDQEATIGIAPFIDMVFLLLIFFMVTSQFDMASGVPIQLPRVSGKTFEESREKVQVVIDKGGQIFLKGVKLDMKGLEKELRAVLREKGLVSLVIQADRNVAHGIVVEAMDTAKTAGVHTIVIAAQWRPQKVY
ncbi:MAG: biopolymer transporter ExbD [Desulfobacteraceae bacterium]|nr:MAG: biopolymer transporter ExbD [Desulfobacteraceae bacterium]